MEKPKPAIRYHHLLTKIGLLNSSDQKNTIRNARLSSKEPMEMMSLINTVIIATKRVTLSFQPKVTILLKVQDIMTISLVHLASTPSKEWKVMTESVAATVMMSFMVEKEETKSTVAREKTHSMVAIMAIL
jgi:hypothetical protein